MDWSDFYAFVRKHASPAHRRALLSAATVRYNSKFPNIYLTYYSMPDWLEVLKLESDLTRKPFESLALRYRQDSLGFQSKLRQCLDAIAGLNPQGKHLGSGVALLQELSADRSHSVRIMPNWHWRQAALPGPFNASPRAVRRDETLAHVTEGLFNNFADGSGKHVHLLDDQNMPLDEFGTGKGTNVVLFYSPWDWINRASGIDAPGFNADEVLFHELVHVSRMFRGAQTGTQVDSKKAGFGNLEEYLATTIANIYLSEKGEPLRGVYGPTENSGREVTVKGKATFWVIDPMPKGFAIMQAPEKFYQNPDNTNPSPRQLMQVFFDTQKPFYKALAGLPDDNPKFNPVKQHFKEN